jgi:hypothetical protein
MILCRFATCSNAVNTQLFASCCSTVYGGVLWSNHSQTDPHALKECYNDIYYVCQQARAGVHSFIPFSPVKLSRDWAILDWESGATVPHKQYSYRVCKHTCPVHRIFCFNYVFSFSTMCFHPSCFCIMYSVPKQVFRLCVVQCTDVCWYCSS